MAKILVTGGNGYIGSHTVTDLLNHNYEVISADNYVNSLESVTDRIKQITGKTFVNYRIDLTEKNAVNKLFNEHPDIEGVIHFAALKAVGESVENPLLYYQNNLNSLLNVLECASQHKVKAFIFSSSCSVYGNADSLPVTEETPLKNAESPYAYTKQIGEQILLDYTKVNRQPAIVSLRYFNPAGAHPSGLIGEQSKVKALNLVPVITETAAGIRDKVVVFGNDYPTRDGSCVRDYIHVMDLAFAHTKALQHILNDSNPKPYDVFNLGIGEGVTVLEAIHAFEKVTAQKLQYQIGPRRAGDVVEIYANNEKASRQLGWVPKFTIEEIMKTAWKWQLSLKEQEKTPIQI